MQAIFCVIFAVILGAVLTARFEVAFKLSLYTCALKSYEIVAKIAGESHRIFCLGNTVDSTGL